MRIIALDVKTVREILSNFDLTGLDDVVKEAQKRVAEEYRNACEQRLGDPKGVEGQISQYLLL